MNRSCARSRSSSTHSFADTSGSSLLAANRSLEPAEHAEEDTALVEIELHGSLRTKSSNVLVRRVALGDEVLAGRDGLSLRAFDRWVGGRFPTCEPTGVLGRRRTLKERAQRADVRSRPDEPIYRQSLSRQECSFARERTCGRAGFLGRQEPRAGAGQSRSPHLAERPRCAPRERDEARARAVSDACVQPPTRVETSM